MYLFLFVGGAYLLLVLLLVGYRVSMDHTIPWLLPLVIESHASITR